MAVKDNLKLTSWVSPHYFSSAKDQISNETVAVKKLSEPFKSDNIAKHMHREIKLLKQLQHENVCHHYLLEQ